MRRLRPSGRRPFLIPDATVSGKRRKGDCVSKEIERPLGQDLPPAAGKAGRRRITRKGLAVFAAIAALAGTSAIVAMQRDPLRRPAIPVEIAAAPPAPQQQAEPQQQLASREDLGPDGPAIIHVNPPKDITATNSILSVEDPTQKGQNIRISHLPDRALIEASSEGPLPKRGADGRRPFDVYARPWSGARGARVAIVIGGLAVSQTGTQAAIDKLPPEVTLAFATQGNSIGRWMQTARQRGHELLMQIPLEPFDYPTVNPGRATLTVEATPEENVDNLRWALSRTTNYTGVMNYMGARFVSDPQALGPVMAELGKRGLLYLDDGTSARSKAPDQAMKNGVPVATGDMIIDQVQDRGAILKKLDELESTARAKGFAVGTGSAFATTVDAVSSWANEAKKRGIEIVPISAVATDPEKS